MVRGLHINSRSVIYRTFVFLFGSPAMQIQVNTDRHLDGSAELITQFEATLDSTLSRFANRITRVEVHLSDENGSQKSGSSDKRCVLEARLTGMKPIKVSADASSQEQALNDAANYLVKLLGRTLDRLDNHKGRASHAGEATN
jgi:ribosome-associated translation inhibitor RaiA